MAIISGKVEGVAPQKFPGRLCPQTPTVSLSTPKQNPWIRSCRGVAIGRQGLLQRREWNISPSLYFHHFKGFSSLRFLENSSFGGLLISKKIGKNCGSKLVCKEVIAVYIVQQKTMAVLLELFEQGKFFLGHPVYIYIL